MGFVLHLLLAFAALAVPPLEAPGIGPRAGLVALPLLAALPYLCAWGVRWSALRGRPRVSRTLERLLTLIAVGAQWLVVGLLSWTELVSAEPLDLTAWPGPELLLALVPYLLVELAAIDARARLYAVRGPDLGAVRGFQLRMLGSALVPFVLYLLLSWIVGSRESWRVQLEEVALLSWLFTVAVLAGLVLFLPRLLTLAWSTRPLEAGPRRSRLEALARRAGLRCRELCEWRTGHTMANAAVVGFTPRTRVVLFSDALLESLDGEELESVFAHEIGHARRRHAAVLACYAVALYFLADLAADWIEPTEPLTTVLLLVALVAGWVVGLGYLSRRFELEADLECLRWVGSTHALTRALWKVGGARAYRRTTWRHFSSADRTRFLARVEQDPEVGRRLHRRLRLAGRVGLLLVLIAGGLEVFLASRSWTHDRVLADLRLGRYEQAAERWSAAGRSGEDPGEDPGEDEQYAALERLLDSARELPRTGRTPEALEASARAALVAGQDERSLDLLQLAYLRGRTELGAVLGELEVRLAESEEGLERSPSELPEGWSEAIRRRFGDLPPRGTGTLSEEPPIGGIVPPPGR